MPSWGFMRDSSLTDHCVSLLCIFSLSPYEWILMTWEYVAVVVGMSLAMCVCTEFNLSTDASLVVFSRAPPCYSRYWWMFACNSQTFRIIECEYTKARYLLYWFRGLCYPHEVTVRETDWCMFQWSAWFIQCSCLCFSSAIILSVTPFSQILVTDVADIDSASKPGQANGDITLKLKDFRILHLKISPASLCQEVVASIVELSKLGMLSSFQGWHSVHFSWPCRQMHERICQSVVADPV